MNTIWQLRINMYFGLFVLAFTIVAATNIVFGRRQGMVTKLVALLAGLAAFFKIMQRDTHLPFLGRAAIPATALKDDFVPAGANVKVEVVLQNAKDGDKVIYWGANPGNEVASSPWKAYGEYENTGIATVKNGRAVLMFMCPTRYTVPFGKTLDRHVHYRLCCEVTGMLGRVETAKVNC